MKFVVLVLAVLVLLWLLRGATQRRVRPPSRKPEESAAPQAMVTCAHCGLHLPKDESLPGRGGVFCGEAHRAEYEKKHPST
jgi:uncharacterized protein